MNANSIITIDNDKLCMLQSICQGITRERSQQLLEAANGNMERAIDIFFHQQQEQEQEEQQQLIDDDEIVQIPTTTTTTTITTQSVESSTRQQASRSVVPKLTGSVIKKRSPKLSSCPTKNDVGRKQPRLESFFTAKAQDTQSYTPCSTVKIETIETPCQQSNTSSDRMQSQSVNNMPIIQSSSSLPIEDTANIAIQNDMHDIHDIHDIDQTPFSLSSMSLPREDDQLQPPPDSNPKSTHVADLSFQHLAETLQQLTDTTKRLVKLDVLKELINHIRQQEHFHAKAKTLTCSLLLVLGFRGDQPPLDVGGTALTKALQTILGASRMQLSKAYRQYGDIGDAAASLYQKKTFFVVASIKPLTVLHVYNQFQKIVSTDGRDAKQHILLQLLRACNSKTEIRFLVRLLIGNMRVGANLKTVLAALAMAFVPDENTKNAIEIIQKTHDVCPNLESIITALSEGGLEQVQRDCRIQLLTPIAPMLAHPTHSLKQVAKAMTSDIGQSKPMIMEWKYDGVRCQAHYDGTTIKLFSRHMLETTAQYPDAAQAIIDARQDAIPSIHSFIIDAEIVGVEEVEGDAGTDLRLLPFQDLSRRKKKNDDGQGVRVKVFCFDLMYLNGISYIDLPLHERQAKMKQSFHETADFAFVSSQVLPTFDEQCIRTFLEQAVKKGAEGLMLKLLGSSTMTDNNNTSKVNTNDNRQELKCKKNESPYEAGTRSHCWLKVKRDYVAGYSDTIDVVPIGAWYGHGRKAQKSFLSPVLLAVYDEEEDVYRSICRCMTFTDAMYEAMREFYFYGKPYPAHVGINETEESTVTESNKKNDLDAVDEMDEEEQDGESSSSDDNSVDQDIVTHETIPDEAESLVNCFSHRPSSAYIITNESPPIWFRPMEVFEVSFADMSLSRQHTAAAGLVDDPEGRGVALRFPRFKRRRPDKNPEQATTSLQIAQLFSQQSKQSSNSRRK